MSREAANYTLADLKLVGLPQGYCFESIEQLLKTIEEYFKAVVPGTVTNVVVGPNEPLSTQRTFLWVRQSNSGTFSGFYVFNGTNWVQIYPVPGISGNAGQLFRINGDSANPPSGFEPLSASTAGFNAGDVAALLAENLPAGAGPWRVYWATFVGF